MLKDEKISGSQGMFLVIGVITGASFITLQREVAKVAKTDAWFSVILGGLLGILATMAIVQLGLRFPKQSIIEYSEIVLGKFLGKLFGTTYIIFLLLFGAFTIRKFSEVIISSMLPETPIQVVIITIIIMALYAVLNGLEVIGRLCELLLPIIIGGLLVIFLLAVKEVDLKKLLPFLEAGIKPVAEGSFIAFRNNYKGSLIILMLIPFLTVKKQALKAGVMGVAISGIVFTVLTVESICAFGVDPLIAMTWPTLNLARLISIGGFLERIESIFLAIWVISGFLKLTILLHATALGSAQLAKLQSFKPLLLPLAVITFSIAMIPRNIIELTEATDMIHLLGVVTGIIIPLIMLLIALIRRQQDDAHNS